MKLEGCMDESRFLAFLKIIYSLLLLTGFFFSSDLDYEWEVPGTLYLVSIFLGGMF